MGLGRLFNRSTDYLVTDTVSGHSETFTIVDNIAPDWGNVHVYSGGMSIPGAWRAANLISGLLGTLPWYAYRDLGPDTTSVPITPTPPLLSQPAPPDVAMTTFSSLGLDLLWEGNGIAIIAARNAGGWPTAVFPVPASIVGVRRITDRSFGSLLPIGSIEYNVGGLILSSDDVIHIKGPCAPGALRGMGVIEAHFATLQLAGEQIRQAGNIAKNGVPTGLLTSDNPDVQEEDLIAAKASWVKSQRDRSIAALGMGTKFQAISWDPEEMQLVESRKFTLTDWENIFGLPIGWLGGQTSSRTYSNIEQDAINLLKFTLGQHLARFEQTLSAHLPRGTKAKANLDALLRGDTLNRYQAYKIGIDAGFLTPDEIRMSEDMPPLPEGYEPPSRALPPVQATAEVGSPTKDPAAIGA